MFGARITADHWTHMVTASNRLTQAELEATTRDLSPYDWTRMAAHHTVYRLTVTIEARGESDVLWMAYGHSYREALEKIMAADGWDPDRPRPELAPARPEIGRP